MLDLLDWRRRVAALYAGVRSADTPRTAHDLWQRGRDDLFAHHPQSPLTDDVRAAFTGLPVAPYDPDLRFDVAVEPAPDDAGPGAWTARTGSDGRSTCWAGVSWSVLTLPPRDRRAPPAARGSPRP